MSTVFLSETIKDPVNSSRTADDDLGATLNGGTFKIQCDLYKKDNPEITWTLSETIISTMRIGDSLFNLFQGVILTVDSFFGYTQNSRTTNSSTDQNSPIPFEFGSPGEDYCKLYFCDTTRYPDFPVNTPLINGDFVIYDWRETEIDNSSNTRSSIVLTLMPVAQWKLITSYPQWTTGFQESYGDKTHGKRTGQCLVELLETCGLKMDDAYQVSKTGPMFNYTSMVNKSCYDTLMEVMKYHCKTTPSDPAFLHYTHNNDLFSVVSLSELLSYDQANDDIKNYLDIYVHKRKGSSDESLSDSIKGQHYKLSSSINSTRAATQIILSYPTALRTDASFVPKIYVTRRQNTFKLIPSEYKHDEQMEEIKSRKYLEKNSGGNTKNADNSMFMKEPIDPSYEEIYTQSKRIDFTPAYRTDQIETMSRSLEDILNAAQQIKFNLAGASCIFSGRKMLVKLYDETQPQSVYEKNMVGVYLITETVHSIDIKNKKYDIAITGKKFQRMPLSSDEKKVTGGELA